MPDPSPFEPFATNEGRIARSWRLTRAAWTLVRADRALQALALLGALTGLGGLALILLLSGVSNGAHSAGGRFALFAVIFSYPLTFMSVFINTAIAAAAAAALEGRRLTLAQALAVPTRRIGRVAGWALIVAVVGVVIEQVASRLPAGGSIATRLVGLAWGLASLFAIPILALEDCSPFDCLRRSARLVKQRWGEGISGSIIVTAWTAIAILALVIVAVPFVVIAHDQTAVLVVIAAVVGTALVAILALASVVRQAFLVALYRYATTDAVTGPFQESDLRSPFSPKRGWR